MRKKYLFILSIVAAVYTFASNQSNDAEHTLLLQNVEALSEGDEGYSETWVNNYTPQRNNNSASTSNHSSKWEFSYVRATTGYTKSGSTTTIYVYVNNKNPRELRASFSESKDGTTRQATKQIYNNTEIGMKYKYYILNYGTAYYFN